MSNRHAEPRAAGRARKAFAHAAAGYANAKAEAHAVKRLAKAERRERCARRSYLEALRLADLAEG